MSNFIKAKNAVSKELYEVEMILKNIGKSSLQFVDKNVVEKSHIASM